MQNFRQKLFSLVVFASSLGAMASSPPPKKFDMKANTFWARANCIALTQPKTLAPGSELTVFSGKTPRKLTVTKVWTISEIKKVTEGKTFKQLFDDKPIWNKIGDCYWSIKTELDALTGVAELSERTDGAIAIHDLPAQWVAIGGETTQLKQEEIKTYLSNVETKDQLNCTGSKSLMAGWKFAAVGGYEIRETFLGKPKYDEKNVIQSIDICHFVFNNKALVEKHTFSRNRDQEERADSEGPDLKPDNWAKTMDSTVGFIVQNPTNTWQRIAVNIGFEGIYYWIKTLGPIDDPEIQGYMYTRH